MDPNAPQSKNTMQVIVGVTLGAALLLCVGGGFYLAANKIDTPTWIVAIPASVIAGFLGWLAPSPSLKGTSQLNTSDVTDLLKAATAPGASLTPVMMSGPAAGFHQITQTAPAAPGVIPPDAPATPPTPTHDDVLNFQRA